MAVALDPPPTVVRPQAGPQELFLSSPADIVIFGGAAGGGKTWALLIEPVRHQDNRNFGAVIFRRTYTQITNEGGLWDEAADVYTLLDARPNETALEYEWPSGMTVKFAHMQHAKDRFAWKGAQIPLIEFDQLEDFEEEMFWYMLSRNRSARAGIRPYVRATVNPVPDDDPVGGWLNKLIAWWINQETGYPIHDRSGIVRWFIRRNEELHWAPAPEFLLDDFPDSQPKSLTFIPARLEDNQILERADPGYRAWLMALPLVDRERLLGGNWKIRATAGLMFDRAWFKILPTRPNDVVRWVRYWDKAGTEKGGKYSAGVLIGQRPNKDIVIADVVRGQWSSFNRERTIAQTAAIDAPLVHVTIWVEQEPGSGGKESAENTVLNLQGHDVHADRVTGDKLTRAKPLSAQAEAGNVYLVSGPWNEQFLSEAHRFDGITGVMDQIDAAAGGFNKLVLGPGPTRRVRISGI